MNTDLVKQAIALLQQAISEPTPVPGPIPEPVPPAKAITSVKFRNLGGAQSDVPFTFGQVFAVGHLQPGTGLYGKLENGVDIALQVDEKALHADGSVRHAIISGVVPTLFEAETREMALIPGVTAAQFKSIAAPTPQVTVFCKVGDAEYRADLGELLRDKPITRWLDGRLVEEQHVDAPLRGKTEHPHLAVRFALRDYAVGRARVDISIENDWAYEPGPQNFTYDLRIQVEGETVHEAKAFTHYHHARQRQIFWVGGEPQLHIRHDPRYLIDTMALPNYDPEVTVSEKYLAGLGARWAAVKARPMGAGLALPGMPTTGGREDIGLQPAWAVAYLLSQDPRAAKAAIGTADLAGSWSMHYRDKNTCMPVSLIDFPYMTLVGNPGDTKNPATKLQEKFPAVAKPVTPNQHDISHQPNFSYLPYITTGDYYHLEELQFWAMYNVFNSNPNYRGNMQGLLKPEQVRGQAWGLRTLTEAAYITPDSHPLKSHFLQIVDANLDWYNAEYTDNPTANKLGAIINGYSITYENETALAPWMDDFFTSAVGRAAELGFEKAKPLVEWKARFPILRMIGDGACPIFAAMYNMRVRDTKTGPIYSTIGEAFDKSTATIPTRSLPCGGSEMAARLGLKVGEMTGYSSSTAGYPSNMQPALAFAAQFGGEDGKKAWAAFMSRSVKPDYSTGPQFAIVPR